MDTKEQKRFDRMHLLARQYGAKKFSNKYVSPTHQEMVRAEAGAKAGLVPAMVVSEETGLYELREIESPLGYCVCVTCGARWPWKGDRIGGGKIDAGHVIPGKRASVQYEPNACFPQCVDENRNGGRPDLMRAYVIQVYGKEEMNRLDNLHNNVSKVWTIDELVILRMGFMDRIKAAKEQML